MPMMGCLAPTDHDGDYEDSGLTQPRLNQLLKGKIGEFSLDALVNLATCAGMRVGLTIRPMAGVRAKAAKVAKVVQAGQRQTA